MLANPFPGVQYSRGGLACRDWAILGAAAGSLTAGLGPNPRLNWITFQKMR